MTSDILGHGFLSKMVPGPGDIATWLNGLHDDYAKVDVKYICPTGDRFVVVAEVWE